MNECDAAFYLMIAVIHRLPPGAAETPHHPWYLLRTLWDLHQSSLSEDMKSNMMEAITLKRKKKKIQLIYFLVFVRGKLHLIHLWYYTLFSVMMTNSDGNIVRLPSAHIYTSTRIRTLPEIWKKKISSSPHNNNYSIIMYFQFLTC